ncbi:cytidylyltransferase domain-containing protein [Thermodesulfobacteriota bacterium]
MMKKIAIIPARGGSKRLPRKNVRRILGEPMLTYPIKVALESNLFKEVIVSTEDDEISAAAISVGAKVVKRPAHLGHDRATVVEVCLDVLKKLEEEQPFPEYFCCIYATALFLNVKDLKDSFNLIHEKPVADFVMGVSEFNLHPLRSLEKSGYYLRPKWPEYIAKQSQFQPHLVASNGTLYWARTKIFKETMSFYGEKLKGYEIPKTRAIDLDTPDDLKLAEALASEYLLGNV